MSDHGDDDDYYDMLNDPEPGTCRQCGAAPVNEAGICATCDDEHTALVTKALDAIPGYPFLPCPICRGIEGCDHSVAERATAYELANGPHDHDHI